MIVQYNPLMITWNKNNFKSMYQTLLRGRYYVMFLYFDAYM